MRSRHSGRKLKIVMGLAVALVVILAVSLSVRHYRQPEAAPPEALAHIAAKNREAAIVAAAHQRSESAVSTNSAENLAEARRHGDAAAANAALARIPNDEAAATAAGRRD